MRTTRETLSRVVHHLGHEAQREQIPERRHFLRGNLGDYDVEQILQITEPTRLMLGMSDELLNAERGLP